MRLLKRRMKWYCSVFPFGSFWVFVKLPDRWAETVCCSCRCVCLRLCTRKKKKKNRERKSLWKCQMQKRLRVISSLCLCQSTALITSPPQLRAGSRAKPTWTRLNQAWTYSAQHALCFKPWLIGPGASQSPFPAVTATGLKKKKGIERERKNMPKKFIYVRSRWIDTICVVLIFEILSFFFFYWLSWVEAERCIWHRVRSKCRETTDNEAIWPSKWEDGEKRPVLVVAACSLSVCQFKESHRMSQVHLTAALTAGASLALPQGESVSVFHILLATISPFWQNKSLLNENISLICLK